MATVIINSSTPEPFSAATPAAKSTSSLALAGNWFFYSNNPETVQASHLADSGRYLNRVYVTGEGQLYTWHANGTGSTIKNCILIHNPDPNNSIKVTATNYGLTHSVGYTSPDTNAWLDFWGSSMANPITVTVGPNGYGNIFLRDISSNAASFGIIARLKITDLSGNPKSAYLYDLAYISNSGGAHSIASTDGTQRRRGVANTGYWAEINFAALAPTNEHGLYYLLAAPGDTFNGTDMPYINDPGGTVSGPLEGNYGQQIQITLPIRNSSTTEDFNYGIYIGSSGGLFFPCFYYNGIGYKYNYGWGAIGDWQRLDILSVPVPRNQTVYTNFQVVVPAVSNTPLVVGARRL